MPNILIIGEHGEGQSAQGKIKKVTQELASKGAELASKAGGGAVQVAFIGNVEAPEGLGAYGVKKVTVINSSGLAQYNTEGYTKVLAELVAEEKPTVILATASPLGKDLLPRLAARLGCGLASDCTNLNIVDGKLVATRPIYAGKALVDVQYETPIQAATARPNSFVAKVTAEGAKAEVATVSKEAGAVKAAIKEVIKGKSDKPDLTEASVIVSGGRAMKSAENFKILNELADVIGATVGASRAAVDSGYATHDMQVGQTGKVVNPNLYIACGISGAIQHLAGMRTSKVIVAINKDPEAPIFTKADYGIVGDLFQVVPLLTQELKKALAE